MDSLSRRDVRSSDEVLVQMACASDCNYTDQCLIHSLTSSSSAAKSLLEKKKRLQLFQGQRTQPTAKGGKPRPRGHMSPNELLNPALRGFVSSGFIVHLWLDQFIGSSTHFLSQSPIKQHF